jgi:hypothetical protein
VCRAHSLMGCEWMMRDPHSITKEKTNFNMGREYVSSKGDVFLSGNKIKK